MTARVERIEVECIRLPCGHLLETPTSNLKDHACEVCGRKYRIIARTRKGGFYTCGPLRVD